MCIRDRTWNAASGLNLQPTQSVTFILNGAMGLVCAPQTVDNTAVVNGGTVCQQVAVQSNTVTSTVNPPVYAYTVAKVQTPANPAIGAPVNYTITVVNTGTGTIDNLVLSDTVSAVITGQVTGTPAGFTLGAIGNTASGTRYDWTNAGAFNPGTTAVFTVDGFVGAVCAGVTVSNTAMVTAVTACGTSSQKAVASGFTLAAPVVAFTVVKSITSANPAPGVGEPVQYTIVVTNTGTVSYTHLRAHETGRNLV